MAAPSFPPIRTDWLADVCWRLAEVGLERLRRSEGRLRLTDVVDGESWRFAGSRLSERWDTTVDIDADLFLPSDEGGATMRAGFQLTPGVDHQTGAPAVRVRVEIGPRGPVTFDPENWIVPVPRGRERPAVGGVQPGVWELRTGDEPAHLDLGALPGNDLDLEGVAPVVIGEELHELVLGVHTRVERTGRFSRLLGARHEKAVSAVLRLTAEGPIRAAWQGGGGADILAGGGLTAIATAALDSDRLTLVDDDHQIALHAAGLQVEVLSVGDGAAGGTSA